MAAFETDVMNATQEQDKARRAQEEYDRMAQQMQRQFGAQQQAGTPTLGIGTMGGADAATVQAKTDEFNRRKAAATNAFDLGAKVDTRRSQLSDELSAALTARKNAQLNAETKQSQDTREAGLNTEQTIQSAKEKTAMQDFQNYKSQTDRNQAMKELKDKGELDKSLAKAASENALKQQDIDNYYAMLEAEARADYESAVKNADWAMEALIKKNNISAKNTAAIISGGVQAVNAGITYANRPKDTGAK